MRHDHNNNNNPRKVKLGAITLFSTFNSKCRGKRKLFVFDVVPSPAETLSAAAAAAMKNRQSFVIFISTSAVIFLKEGSVYKL